MSPDVNALASLIVRRRASGVPAAGYLMVRTDRRKALEARLADRETPRRALQAGLDARPGAGAAARVSGRLRRDVQPCRPQAEGTPPGHSRISGATYGLEAALSLAWISLGDRSDHLRLQNVVQNRWPRAGAAHLPGSAVRRRQSSRLPGMVKPRHVDAGCPGPAREVA